jgi:hypothetical protein
MDFETPAEPSADPMAAGSQETLPAEEGASTSEPTGEAKDKPQEAQEPKLDIGQRVPPIPSSALVIMPPQRRFEAKDAAPKDKKPGKRKWFGTASRAALFIILCGGAFAAGGHFFGSTPPAEQAADPAAASWQLAKNEPDAAQMSSATAALSEEIHGIETRLDALRAAVQSPEEVRALKKSIDSLRASLEAQKAEANASIAQLSAKLDELQHAEPARLTEATLEKSERAEAKTGIDRATDPKAIQATLDRAARAEKTDVMTTASIPATAPQTTGVAPLAMAPVEPQKKPPQYLTNWVVRDVYDGIALVESPEGAIEVMPGDMIPGAGMVKSIERRNGGWIVVTSRGLVDYARD